MKPRCCLTVVACVLLATTAAFADEEQPLRDLDDVSVKSPVLWETYRR